MHNQLRSRDCRRRQTFRMSISPFMCGCTMEIKSDGSVSVMIFTVGKHLSVGTIGIDSCIASWTGDKKSGASVAFMEEPKQNDVIPSRAKHLYAWKISTDFRSEACLSILAHILSACELFQYRASDLVNLILTVSWMRYCRLRTDFREKRG